MELSAEQEILKVISGQIKKYPILTGEQEQELLLAYKTPFKNLLLKYIVLHPPENKLNKVNKRKKEPGSDWDFIDCFWKNNCEYTNKEYRDYILAQARQNLLTPGSTEYSPEAKRAIDKLVLHNIRLAFKYARKANGGTLTTYDLLIHGIDGLFHAIDKYDFRVNKEKKNLKLSTSATWWVRQYIQRAIQDFGRTIRIPIHIHDQINQITKRYGEYSSTHFDEQSPNSTILSELTGLPKKQVEVLGTYLFDISSLDEVNTEEENAQSMSSQLPADPIKYQPEYLIENHINRVNLLKTLDKLDPDDSAFLKLYYGLGDGIDRSNREMASIFRVTYKEIDKRHELLVQKLRTIANEEDFSL